MKPSSGVEACCRAVVADWPRKCKLGFEYCCCCVD